MSANEPASGARRAIADVYDEPGIVWAMRSVGTHLHPGSEDATVALAARAAAFDFPVGGLVLDIASALGGPARYVARRFAATVLGVDASVQMHTRALASHRNEELALRCPLLVARAERLPLADASCDAAWSQDALCHMDKSAVVAEVARVLRPGGAFAFTDWIARRPLPAEASATLAKLWSFPSLLRISEYVRLLDDRGLDVLVAEDRTPVVVQQRLPQAADQAVWEQTFAARFGAEQVDRQREPGTTWRALVQEGLTGHGLFIARRPD